MFELVGRYNKAKIFSNNYEDKAVSQIINLLNQDFVAGTAYGDGSYLDNEGREYGVDAGILGIIPLYVCDGDSMDGGHVVTFEESFEVYNENNTFHFGNVVIPTGDEENNEEDDSFWDWGDENFTA